MKLSISTYWKCQLIGWSILFLITSLNNAIQTPGATGDIMNALIGCLFGLAYTHFLRFIIKQFKFLSKSTLTQIIYLLLLNSILVFFATWFLIWVLLVAIPPDKTFLQNLTGFSFWGTVFWTYYQTLTVITGWTAIYFVVHYIRNLRKSEYEKAALRVRLAESEMMALRAQMNPQYIFNSMNSIKSMITENENDRAANYLTTFSKLIRTLFQNSDKKEISLFEEIETCKLYTKVEQMRFNDKIEFVFNIDETIDLKDIKVPALILHPFIENAIWHGLMPKKTGGRVVFSVQENDGVVECVIDDDGIGLELSKKYKAQYEATHQPKGIGLTQSRLGSDKLLNERGDNIFIIDKEGENGKSEGTKVIVTFKENRS